LPAAYIAQTSATTSGCVAPRVSLVADAAIGVRSQTDVHPTQSAGSALVANASCEASARRREESQCGSRIADEPTAPTTRGASARPCVDDGCFGHAAARRRDGPVAARRAHVTPVGFGSRDAPRTAISTKGELQRRRRAASQSQTRPVWVQRLR
jgi:hypothetical protein